MVKLTKDEKALLLVVGSTKSTALVVMDEPQKVSQALVEKGLLYLRAKNHWDLTDEGEEVYEQLKREKKAKSKKH